MTREEKNQLIDSLAEQIKQSSHFYLTDISGFTVATTNSLRAYCFRRDIRLTMVKNALLHKAMERSGKNLEGLYDVLKGSTAVMFTEAANAPAKLIQEFRQKEKKEKPILKGAYVQESTYVGNDQLDALINLKTKNELIADVVALLQSPARNVIMSLQSGGHKLSGILKTLSEKAA